MAQAAVVAPLLWRWWSRSTFSASKHHFPSPFSPNPCFNREFSRVWGLRPVSRPVDRDETEWEEEEERYRESRIDKKSKNELKREARRAVQWGMELSKLSPSQIKRAMRIASLEDDIFEAFMLVKRMGADVKEGKRRQFNYIGSLLRNAESEIMDKLVEAYKVNDTDTINALIRQSQTKPSIDEDEIVDQEEIFTQIESEEVEEKEEEKEEEEEVDEEYVKLASRWFEGLIRKDSSITNEVYSIHSVEFDRQELRKLVRRVQENQDNGVAILNREKRPLMRFLRSLAKSVNE